MTARGKQLENAIAAACAVYRRQGRADIWKRATRMVRTRDGYRHAGKNGVDFAGVLKGGQAVAFDAKETHAASFPLADFPEHQRDHLHKAAELGAHAGLVIAFMPLWECYWMPYAGPLAEFLAAPWRQSLSVDMCRAWGLLLPVRASAAGRAFVMFLDGKQHADMAKAVNLVVDDRALQINHGKLPKLHIDDSNHRPSKRTERLLSGKLDPFSPEELRRAAKRRGARTGWWNK